jgi:hypothetical protein
VAVLPLIVPFIVLAVSLFLLFSFIDVPRSLLTIAAGHSVQLPFATLILLARLSGMDPALDDAARTGCDVPDHIGGDAAADRSLAAIRLAHLLHRLVRRSGGRDLRRRRPHLPGVPCIPSCASLSGCGP